MERLELSTKKSLYPAFEIGIDVEGVKKIYRTRKLTRAFLREIEPVEEAISKQDPDAVENWVKMMLAVPQEILDQLEEQEIEDIYTDLAEKFRDRQKKRMEKQVESLKGTLTGFEDVEKMLPKKRGTTKNRKRPGAKK